MESNHIAPEEAINIHDSYTSVCSGESVDQKLSQQSKKKENLAGFVRKLLVRALPIVSCDSNELDKNGIAVSASLLFFVAWMVSFAVLFNKE